MDINGIDKFIDKLGSDYSKRIDELRDEIGKSCLSEVKRNTPVDKGRLKRTWKIKKISDDSVAIYNNTSYAAHVEHGHRTKSSKSSTIIRVIPGRFMLRDSLAKTKQLMRREVKMFYKDIWK